MSSAHNQAYGSYPSGDFCQQPDYADASPWASIQIMTNNYYSPVYQQQFPTLTVSPTDTACYDQHGVPPSSFEKSSGS